MNQEIIKATDANKSIAKVNILDAMEMQLKKQLKRFSLNDQTNAQIYLDKPFI